jgi:hypothetical protein
LDVVEVLKHLDEAQVLARPLRVDLDGVLGDHRALGRLDLDARRVERLADLLEPGRRGVDLDDLVARGVDVVGAGVSVESAESAMIAKNTVELDSAKARQALRLVELLEDLDDVQRVTANFDIPEDVFAEVAG